MQWGRWPREACTHLRGTPRPGRGHRTAWAELDDSVRRGGGAGQVRRSAAGVPGLTPAVAATSEIAPEVPPQLSESHGNFILICNCPNSPQDFMGSVVSRALYATGKGVFQPEELGCLHWEDPLKRCWYLEGRSLLVINCTKNSTVTLSTSGYVQGSVPQDCRAPNPNPLSDTNCKFRCYRCSRTTGYFILFVI